MHRDIHDVLDGLQSRGALSPDQLAEVIALEGAIETAAGPLISTTAPDFAGRVMARINAEMVVTNPPAARGSLFGRVAVLLWSPRPVSLSLRPAYGLVMAGLVAMVVATRAAGPPADTGDLLAGAIETPNPVVYVQFRLQAEGADRVALAGSFSRWQADHEMRQTEPGVWSVLLPLEPGVHDYAFIVDEDRWISDPHALQVDDGFGGVNSRIALPLIPAPLPRS